MIQYNVVSKFIDISQWQGVIDWDTVAPNIDGAIIRCGWGSDYIGQDDSQYSRNVSECERLAIPYGIYIYSYAISEDQARSEAHHVLRLIDGHTPALPVYFDSEESGTEFCARANAIAFCDVIREAGYIPGVYASLSWWQNYLGTINDVSVWCARWQCDTPGMDCDMWQYTSDGSVPGIAGRVDMNEYYGGFDMLTDSEINLIAARVWEYIYKYGTEDQDRTLEGCGIDSLSNGYNVLRQAFMQAYDANKRIESLEKKLEKINYSDCTQTIINVADMLIEIGKSLKA